MKTLWGRVRDILLHPAKEWLVIREERATFTKVFLRYVAVLAAVPPAAAIAGRYLFGWRISHAVLQPSFAYLAFTNILWYAMYVLNVVLAGIIITLIVTTPESRWSVRQGFTLAAYSFTPLFLSGLVAVIPSMGWIVNAAILYGIYLLYHGIVGLAGAGRGRALWYTAVSFVSAAVIVGVMNLFEYVLESFVTSQLSL
jgi:hypothetical protein